MPSIVIIIVMSFITITLVRIIVKMTLIIKENVKRLYQRRQHWRWNTCFQKNSLKPLAKIIKK